MSVEKFSISLPAELTAELDALALSEGLSRSGLVREATAEYIAAKNAAATANDRKRRVDNAIAGFDEIASRWGEDQRTALELLREVRGEAAVVEPATEPDDCAGRDD